MSTRPNIILIMTDQWRGDCLSIDNHPVVQTPHLDELALNGARFTRAYSGTPTCIAARAALFTGLTQEHHGRVGYQDGVPWDYPVTLAGEFTRHGYQTQAIGKMHVWPERSQLGFQNVILHDGFLGYSRAHHPDFESFDDYMPWLRERHDSRAQDFDHGVHCNSGVARPWDKPEHLHPTNFVTDQSLQFLKRRDPRKPFFLFMSFHRPHPPYDPPTWAFEQYLHEPMPEPPVGEWSNIFATHGNAHLHDTFFGDIGPLRLQRARAGYYGHMTHIDHQINRLIWALRTQRLFENTIICFVSDHGEMMGDHHLFRKGFPYEGSARIPFILRGTRELALTSNRVYDQVIELRDVMPTLLDCAGLPIPESVDGKSLLPILQGKSSAWRDYLHGEHVLFEQSIQWLTNGHDKYVWFSRDGCEQLFDLDVDPREVHNRANDPAYADRLASWRQILIQELSGREEGFVQDNQLIAGRAVNPCLAFLRQAQ
jgi:arylsulfatase